MEVLTPIAMACKIESCLRLFLEAGTETRIQGHMVYSRDTFRRKEVRIAGENRRRSQGKM